MNTFTADDVRQARAAFHERGESIAEWAREHGFSASAVYQVLSGRSLALRGEAHRIAVELGLKRRPLPATSARQPLSREGIPM